MSHLGAAHQQALHELCFGLERDVSRRSSPYSQPGQRPQRVRQALRCEGAETEAGLEHPHINQPVQCDHPLDQSSDNTGGCKKMAWISVWSDSLFTWFDTQGGHGPDSLGEGRSRGLVGGLQSGRSRGLVGGLQPQGQL